MVVKLAWRSSLFRPNSSICLELERSTTGIVVYLSSFARVVSALCIMGQHAHMQRLPIHAHVHAHASMCVQMKLDESERRQFEFAQESETLRQNLDATEATCILQRRMLQQNDLEAPAWPTRDPVVHSPGGSVHSSGGLARSPGGSVRFSE